MNPLRHLAPTILGTLACLLASAPAQAASISDQQRAASAGFLTDLAPPAASGTLCLVDTGVNQTQTIPTVVERLSVGGADVGDHASGEGEHGTLVAQVIAGRLPGFGVFGIFPSAPIVSVRANLGPDFLFMADDIVAAVDLCVSRGVQVINLSLGAPSELDPEILFAVQRALQADVSVVASAGNRPGDPIDNIASIPGVVSVGGVYVSGERCGSSVSVPTSLVALGCDVMVAPTLANGVQFYNGTSFAAPQVSAAILALRAYKPDLTARQAEGLLLERAHQRSGGAMLDVSAAFTAAGIPTTARVAPAVPATAGASARAATARLPKPSLTVLRRGAYVQVIARNRPRGARLVATQRGRQVAASTSSLLIPARRFRATTLRFRLGNATSTTVVIKRAPAAFVK